MDFHLISIVFSIVLAGCASPSNPTSVNPTFTPAVAQGPQLPETYQRNGYEVDGPQVIDIDGVNVTIKGYSKEDIDLLQRSIVEIRDSTRLLKDSWSELPDFDVVSPTPEDIRAGYFFYQLYPSTAYSNNPYQVSAVTPRLLEAYFGAPASADAKLGNYLGFRVGLMNELGHLSLIGPAVDITDDLFAQNGELRKYLLPGGNFSNDSFKEIVEKVVVEGAVITVVMKDGNVYQHRRFIEMINDALLRANMEPEEAAYYDSNLQMLRLNDKHLYFLLISLCLEDREFASELSVRTKKSDLYGILNLIKEKLEKVNLQRISDRSEAEQRALTQTQEFFDNAFKRNN